MARAKSPAASRKRPPSKAPASAAADAPLPDESSLVVMGRIVGAFGVQGWLKVAAFTESPDGLARFARWMLRTRAGWSAMDLEDFAVHSKGPVAKLAGCDDREAADALRGAEVAVGRAELGEAEKGSLFWVDLVGLEVVEQGGESLGRVEALFEAGDTSVLVVKGARERMIPFVPGYVKAVDREARRITVEWKADYDT